MMWLVILWCALAVVWAGASLWCRVVDWPFIGLSHPWVESLGELLLLTGLLAWGIFVLS